MASTDGAVTAAIERELAAFPGSAGLAVKHLGTGEEIRINADAETPTASTIKVPILIALFDRIEAGELVLETSLAVSAKTQAPGSGILRDLSLGITLSVRDLATLMIVVSDNTATNMLIDLVGLERVNATMAKLGFPRTRLIQRLDFPKIGKDPRNLAVSTPAELAGIMEALATGRILGKASRAAILEIMRRQKLLGLVPRYLPHNPYAAELDEPDNGLRIATKTGGLDRDAGRHGARRVARRPLRDRDRDRGRPGHPLLGRERRRPPDRPRLPPRL